MSAATLVSFIRNSELSMLRRHLHAITTPHRDDKEYVKMRMLKELGRRVDRLSKRIEVRWVIGPSVAIYILTLTLAKIESEQVMLDASSANAPPLTQRPGIPTQAPAVLDSLTAHRDNMHHPLLPYCDLFDPADPEESTSTSLRVQSLPNKIDVTGSLKTGGAPRRQLPSSAQPPEESNCLLQSASPDSQVNATPIKQATDQLRRSVSAFDSPYPSLLPSVSRSPTTGPGLDLTARAPSSPISKSMPAHEVVRQLSAHGCRNITNDLDIGSFDCNFNSCGGF
ncbi:hypothetical protein FRC12_020587, partial [Ceratobasidium sp. 428]